MADAALLYAQANVGDTPTVLGDGDLICLLDTMELRTASGGNVVPLKNLVLADGGGLVIGHTTKLTISNKSELQVLGTSGKDSSMILARFSNGSTPPSINFYKSRSGTIGVDTVVQDNDRLGQLKFIAADGASQFNTKAAIFMAEVDDASPAAGDVGAAFVWEQMPGDGGASRETMRLDAAGLLTVVNAGLFASVDIGAHIGAKLDISFASASGADGIYIDNTGGHRWGIFSGGASSSISNSLGLYDADAAAYRMTINASGTVTVHQELRVGTTVLADAIGDAAFGSTTRFWYYEHSTGQVHHSLNTTGVGNVAVYEILANTASSSRTLYPSISLRNRSTGTASLAEFVAIAGDGVVIGSLYGDRFGTVLPGTGWGLWGSTAHTLYFGTNGVERMSISSAGVVATVGELKIGGALNHDGATAGFYTTVPIAQQTGVAVTVAGVHAALVALGLFTA